MLYDVYGLSSDCNIIHDDQKNPLYTINAEQTLFQYVVGLIFHQSVHLAHTMENSYYRIAYVSYSHEDLLTVLYEESMIYIKMFWYFILGFAASLWIGFIIGWIAGYCFTK